VILLEGDTEAPVLFVLQGTVRVFRTNLDGREQTLIVLSSGDALNLPGAFTREPGVAASAMAESAVRALVVPAAALREVVLCHPSVGLALLQVLAERLQHLSALAYDLGLLGVRARLARFLLAERRGESDTPVRWTHAQIAARVGSVRVVVSRTLSAMAGEGLIRLDRQHIEVLDREALREVAELADV
jgi:CRP/FNR family transcriptional regulator